MFTKMTVSREHPEGWIDPESWKSEAIGWTSDTADIEYLKEIGEVSVNGQVVLADSVGIEAYDKDVIELSPGYSANFIWKKGKHRGQTYDAIMTEVTHTNHLALVNRGRGGKWSAITDAVAKLQTNAKKIASGLWWAVKRRSLIKDQAKDESASQAMGFWSGLDTLASQRQTMSEMEIENRVEQLRSLVIDLPYGDEKSLLMSYLDDLKLMKEYPDEVVRSAIQLACALFDKLDRESISQAVMAFGDSKEDGMKLSDLLGLRGKAKDASEDCSDCHGTGMKDGKPCDMCDGTGHKKVADKTPEEHAGIDPKGILIPAKGSAEIPTIPTAEPAAVKADAVPEVKAEEVKKTESPIKGVTDEPDPDEPPAAVPGATPMSTTLPAGEAPGDPPSEPVGSGPVPAPAAPAAPAAAAPQKTPAEVLADAVTAAIKQFMDSTSGQGTAAPAAAPAPASSGPGAPAPAQPPAPAKADAQPAPAAAPAPEKPAEEKKEPPKAGDSVVDSASSLTALLSSSKQVADGAPGGLEGLLNSVRGRKSDAK